MDFLDNVVKSSNAILQSSKERINNQFQGLKSQASSASASSETTPLANTTTADATENDGRQQQQPILDSSDANANAEMTTEQQQQQQAASQSRSGSSAGADGNFSDKMNSQFAAIAADAEMVTQKTVKGAKNIGNFLFSMGNKAGQTVMQTAKQVKQAVESTNILTDFTREQQEFIKEHGGAIQVGDLPWTNIENEQKQSDMKEQVLTLSQDKRNFVRNPPNDFQFDAQQSYPIALSLLKEDPNLGKMRFELVPKLISEDTFWRNYFYRVSLLKQMSERGGDIKRQSWASSRSSSGEGPDDEVTVNEDHTLHTSGTIAAAAAAATGAEDSSIATNPSYAATNDPSATSFLTKQDTLGQTTNQEFESTTTNTGGSDTSKLFAEADDLKSRLRELNIGSFDEGQDENNEWEEELQKDLQEFELVSGDVSALDEEALDRDIMEMKKNLK